MRIGVNASLFLAIFFTSCVVSKPDAELIHTADYNGRVRVEGAHFRKRLTFAGVGAMIAGAAGGAYWGYETPILVKQDGEFREPRKYANAVIGALAGFASVNTINYLFGMNKKKDTVQIDKWVRKANKDYLMYKSVSPGDFTLISANAESGYQVRSYEDVSGFYRVFPNSLFTDGIFQSAVTKLGRHELPNLLVLDKENLYAKEAKLQYYKKSQTIQELFEAADRYPGVEFPLEDSAVKMVEDFDGAIVFIERFPESLSKKEVFVNSLFNIYRSHEAKKMYDRLNEFFYLKETDLKNRSGRYHKHYLEALLAVKKPSEKKEYLKLFSDYDWITFNQKSDFVLDYLWKSAYDDYVDGNRLVGEIIGYAKLSEFRRLGIERAQADDFLKRKLSEEARKNVAVVQTSLLDTRNTDIDTWKESFFFDAPYIKSTGEIKFLYYGKVKNNSKFDLPVDLTVSGQVVRDYETEIFNISIERKTKHLGTKKEHFYIPYLPAGEESDFAVLFDFGIGQQSSGINILGVQSSEELTMRGFDIEPDCFKGTISSSTRRKQQLWMDMVNKGLPTVQIKDVLSWGSQEYSPDDYVIDWSSISSGYGESDGEVGAGYRISKQDNAYVRVEFDDYVTDAASISIYSNDEECEYYFSSVSDKYETKTFEIDDGDLFSADGPLRDNDVGYFYSYPVTVQISYKSGAGILSECDEWVSAEVVIYGPGAWTIVVEPD